MKNDKKKWYTSVWAIVLALYLFFPVGFIFLYLRLKEKKGKYNAITSMLYWIGLIWGVFGILYLGLSISEETFVSEYLAPGIFIFVIPGAITFFFGNKRKQKGKVYVKYLNYIKARKKVKLDNLCNQLSVDLETATNIITEMINKEIINGYLSEDELILKGVSDDVNDPTKEVEVKKETKIVKCRECGAKNTVIIGESKECEYCGTILQ